MNLPELTKDQLKELDEGFINKNDFDESESWFWNHGNDDYCEVILDMSTIRDLMRKDLSCGKSNLITLTELINKSTDKISVKHVSPSQPEMALIVLTQVWLDEATENKLSQLNRICFAFLISYGCYGMQSGYLNSFHRKAEKAFDKLIEDTENTSDPKVTLQIFYAILEFFKVKRKIPE